MKDVADLFQFVQGLLCVVKGGGNPRDYIAKYAQKHFPDGDSELSQFVEGLFRTVEEGADPNDYLVKYAREHFPDQPFMEVHFTFTDGTEGGIVIDDEYLAQFGTMEDCIRHFHPDKTIKTYNVKRK